ncbi:uroporphyrinogen decarboxylase [Baffinella frigidus]|nr:uroporphyrinogen decarboxylase [Cryptophyta sp. CCMP2293]|mmetsp:Transcript_17924/g.43305  ORF Transcript_17924/g.43305 Transcript_17924/m.43305 type:complete len:407 (+) Transcript_17924:159-1379(+)
MRSALVAVAAAGIFLANAAPSAAFAPSGVSVAAPGGRLASAISASKSDRPSTALSLTMEEKPLLLRAALGEKVERSPVWMMRQAGRHMQAYRDLVSKYPTFRERSEIPEVSTEISLQPWRRYGVDGCILFSDILTPLPGMGIEFDIKESAGPKLKPMRSAADFECMKIQDDWAKSMPFVKQTLGDLRKEVGNSATVLGFVGLPYTLATYLIEGGSSSVYLEIKKMMYGEPKLLHTILAGLAENIGNYANFQIDSGAQLIQIFDSWAGSLAPEDYDVFALPYQKIVVEMIKKKHPETPIIIYIAKSGALLERMASTGVDIVSLDWTTTIDDARARIGKDIGIQGNLDPALLYAPKHIIKERTEAILKMAGPYNHVMNLGHGIEATTSEENTEVFVQTVQNYKHTSGK